jgi:hypothetical protein
MKAKEKVRERLGFWKSDEATYALREKCQDMFLSKPWHGAQTPVPRP